MASTVRDAGAHVAPTMGRRRARAHLVEANNVFMVQETVVEDLSLHVFGDLHQSACKVCCEQRAHTHSTATSICTALAHHTCLTLSSAMYLPQNVCRVTLCTSTFVTPKHPLPSFGPWTEASPDHAQCCVRTPAADDSCHITSMYELAPALGGEIRYSTLEACCLIACWMLPPLLLTRLWPQLCTAIA